MFVSDFKQVLTTLPMQEDGYDTFMLHIQEGSLFSRVATEFFIRVTNYALSKSPHSDSAPVQYDSDLLSVLFAVSRFPIEMLDQPEEPLRLTLFIKTIGFLEALDAVLFMHSVCEDDTSDEFLDGDTASRYLHTLNEVFNALTVARGCGCFV